MALIEDNETLQLFIEESQDNLSGIEEDLLAMDEDGENIDEDLVNKVFRAVHSIKGGAGFLGLEKIKDLAHGLENSLNLVRNKELVPVPDVVSVLLDAADLLTQMVNNPQTSNDVDISAHQEKLKVIVETKKAPTRETPPADAGGEKPAAPDDNIEVPLPDSTVIFTLPRPELEQHANSGKLLYLVELDLKLDLLDKGESPGDMLTEMEQTGTVVRSSIEAGALEKLDKNEKGENMPWYVLFATVLEPDLIDGLIKIDPERIHLLKDILSKKEGTAKESAAAPSAQEQAAPAPSEPAAPAEAAPSTPATPTPPPAPAPAPGPKAAAVKPKPDAKKTTGAESLRVHVELLDTLMTLAGELVLTRNQLTQTVADGKLKKIEDSSQRLNLVTSDMQEAIMSTRMQQIGVVFKKFHRVVRDMSRNLGKQINLVTEGEDVDMDKTIIEAIADPLTHLVRNSVDHGIETPEVREKSGKPPAGTLKLSAYHEAGQVTIEISDDGGGIDHEKVKAKALSTGNFDSEQLEKMSEKELVKLIFMPGFSTAEKVTDVSGRGVGMDVVLTNLKKLNGDIDIETAVGVGTTIRIKLPLTLAIIPSQIITIGEERFAIPQVNLVELVRVPPA
ncbi:MAG: chemotaxis protein CheA, partial [Gemmatimonadota bacterium]|nr:chemotaxis protein CheA [Gemmatimonadota bacterium]